MNKWITIPLGTFWEAMPGCLRTVHLRQRRAILVPSCWGLSHGNLTLFCMCQMDEQIPIGTPFGSGRENPGSKARDLEYSQGKVRPYYTYIYVSQQWLDWKQEPKQYKVGHKMSHTITALKKLTFKSVTFYPIQILYFGLSKADNVIKWKWLYSHSRTTAIYS